MPPNWNNHEYMDIHIIFPTVAGLTLGIPGYLDTRIRGESLGGMNVVFPE
jgi:hypothetical protein